MGRRLGTRTFIGAMVMANLLVAECAAAEQGPTQFIDLRLETDPSLRSCPNMAGFRELLAQQLGYDPYRSGAELGVDVRIVPSESRIDGYVDWNFSSHQGGGNRRFSARREDCREMMATISFVVAVQIQLMAAEQSEERASRPEPSSNADPQKELSHQSPLGVSGRSSAQPRLSLRRFELRRAPVVKDRWALASIGSSIGFGLGPSPLVLGRMLVAIRSGWLGLDASVEASLPVEAAEGDAGRFKYELLVGALGTCAWYDDNAACGTVRIGRIQVHGSDVDRPAAPSGLIAEAGPRVVHLFRLADHFGLLVRIDALYSIAPWTVELNHSMVWRLPRFGAAAGIDLAYRFR